MSKPKAEKRKETLVFCACNTDYEIITNDWQITKTGYEVHEVIAKTV